MGKLFKAIVAYEVKPDGSMKLHEHKGHLSRESAANFIQGLTGVVYSDIAPYDEEDDVSEGVGSNKRNLFG